MAHKKYLRYLKTLNDLAKLIINTVRKMNQ